MKATLLAMPRMREGHHRLGGEGEEHEERGAVADGSGEIQGVSSERARRGLAAGRTCLREDYVAQGGVGKWAIVPRLGSLMMPEAAGDLRIDADVLDWFRARGRDTGAG